MKRYYAESDGKTKHIWYVERIWELAEGLDPIEIKIEDIVGLDAVTWFSEGGEQPTVRSIAAHAKRMMQADLSYPPILTEDGRVFDGMHRIARHLMDGSTSILVKQFKTNPEADEVQSLA